MTDASAGSAGDGAERGVDGAEAPAGETAGKKQRKTRPAGTAATYTVHNPRTNATQQLADAREAGAAFLAAEPADRPAVIHSTKDGGARLMATTEIHGTDENGEQRFVKTLPSSHKGDAEFRAGYTETLERPMRQKEAKAKGAGSPQRDKKPRAVQKSKVSQAARPPSKLVEEALAIDASASAAVGARAGDAGQDGGGSHGREVEASVPDGKSVGAFGPDGNSTPPDVPAASEKNPKRIEPKAKAGTADPADTPSPDTGESTKRRPRARKAAAKDDEILPNGIDGPVREGETQLASGVKAYVDQKFRIVAVEEDDKVYLLGGAAAVEKFTKQAQLNAKDGQALRDLHRKASESTADPYELEVLKRVAQLQRMRNQQMHSGNDPARHGQLQHDEIRERSTPAAPTASAKDVIPAELQCQYLKVANKFYHADRPDALAFVDKGERLETKSDSERTAGDLVAIAESREWNPVKVSGSQAFRREVWLEASARGMLVRGYKATDVDRALLEQRIATSRSNAVERDEDPAKPQSRAARHPGPARQEEGTPRPRETPSAADSEASRSTGDAGRISREDRPSPQRIAGTLLDHGPANYKFDPAEPQNYFVKLLDKGSERVVWGVRLGDALQKAGACQGDRVTLERAGADPVTVGKSMRNETGKVVGHERAGAQRTEWKVAVSEESKQARREQAAEDFRTLPLEEAAKRHPDQIAAAGVLAVATVLAREKFVDDRAREQFLDQARNRVAFDLAAGREIRDVQMHRTPKKEREKATSQQTPELRDDRLLERSR